LLGGAPGYARAVVGVGYFMTTSGLSGDDSSYTYASTNNFDDVVFQERVGARREANLWSFRLGVSVGTRRDGGQSSRAVVTRCRSGHATGSDGGAAPLFLKQPSRGDYSGLATPVDPLGADPMPI